MKKKVLLFVAAFLMVLSFASVHTNTASAASWGATKLFTTPKKTRGVWYHKEDGKIFRTKITAHTINGRKVYKALKGKKADKWDKKLVAADEKADYRLANKISNLQYEAYTFKFHGITGFNADGWLAGGGNGYYYVPMKKTVKGKKVNVLRVGEGAGNYFISYAYKNRKLAK